MEDDVEVRAATLLLDCQDYIDIKNVSQRIENMNKAYIDFVAKELEGKGAPPNTELPLVLSMGMTFINGIAATLAYSGANQEFYDRVKKTILENVEYDMDLHYKMGLKDE